MGTKDKYVDIAIDYTEGEWFQYFTSHIDTKTEDVVYDEPVPYARVLIRSVSPFIEERIKKQKSKTEFVLNPKSKKMERVPYVEEQPFETAIKETDDMYDYAILNFEGFRNKKTGETLKCTRENKIALRHNEIFKRFFERCQEILNGNLEGSVKNLSTGSSSAMSKPDPG